VNTHTWWTTWPRQVAVIIRALTLYSIISQGYHSLYVGLSPHQWYQPIVTIIASMISTKAWQSLHQYNQQIVSSIDSMISTNRDHHWIKYLIHHCRHVSLFNSIPNCYSNYIRRVSCRSSMSSMSRVITYSHTQIYLHTVVRYIDARSRLWLILRIIFIQCLSVQIDTQARTHACTNERMNARTHARIIDIVLIWHSYIHIIGHYSNLIHGRRMRQSVRFKHAEVVWPIRSKSLTMVNLPRQLKT
jgi:hypothetical protein